MTRDTKPIIYLSNWSSHKTPGHHGPGRKLTVMATPRRWERGEGRVEAFIPCRHRVEQVKRGEIDWIEYADDFRANVRAFTATIEGLDPGELGFSPWWKPSGSSSPWDIREPRLPVVDGDTLCCACARGKPCHRRIAADFLHEAGWSVILDGKPYKQQGGVSNE